MPLIAEQLRIASQIDAKVRELDGAGLDDPYDHGRNVRADARLQAALGHLGSGRDGRALRAVPRILPLRQDPGGRRRRDQDGQDQGAEVATVVSTRTTATLAKVSRRFAREPRQSPIRRLVWFYSQE